METPPSGPSEGVRNSPYLLLAVKGDPAPRLGSSAPAPQLRKKQVRNDRFLTALPMLHICVGAFGGGRGRRKHAGIRCHNCIWDVLAPLTHHVSVSTRWLRSGSSTYPQLPPPFRAGKGLSGPQVTSTTEIPSTALSSGRGVLGHPGLAPG